MSDNSAIQWTDATWSPVTGCDRVSPGCNRCYALTMARRLKAMGQAKYQTDGDPRTSGPGFGVAVHDDALDTPLRWQKPRRVFVNSMSDLFHARVPAGFIARVFAVMAQCPQHTFQVLTKRPDRMQALLASDSFAEQVEVEAYDIRHLADHLPWPLPNVWLVASVETQKYANLRVPDLLATPAAVHGVSVEPLLGPVDLTRVAWSGGGGTHLDVVHGWHGIPGVWRTEGKRLDWVIVGGESGAGARPMHLDWARQIVRDCQRSGVPVFVKQLGSAWGRTHHDIDTWPEDLRVREYPRTTTAVTA